MHIKMQLLRHSLSTGHKTMIPIILSTFQLFRKCSPINNKRIKGATTHPPVHIPGKKRSPHNFANKFATQGTTPNRGDLFHKPLPRTDVQLF